MAEEEPKEKRRFSFANQPRQNTPSSKPKIIYRKARKNAPQAGQFGMRKPVAKASNIVGFNPKLVKMIGYGSGPVVINPLSVEGLRPQKKRGIMGIGGY